MKENVGRLDQTARFVMTPALVGLALTTLGGRKGNWLGLAALVGAGMLVESAITRVGPTNHLLGIDTRTREERLRDEVAR